MGFATIVVLSLLTIIGYSIFFHKETNIEKIMGNSEIKRKLKINQSIIFGVYIILIIIIALPAVFLQLNPDSV